LSTLSPKRIGDIPVGLTEHHREFLRRMKDAIEILIGAVSSSRETADTPGSKAVTHDDLSDEAIGGADLIGTDTANFDEILSSADDTVQKALDTLDSFLPIDHANPDHLSNVGTNTHAQIDTHLAGHSDTVLWSEIDKTISDIADLTTKSHTALTDKGTYTHAQIDTHIADNSDPHGVALTQTTLTATNLYLNSVNGAQFLSTSTYVFSRYADNDTGLYFDISALEYQFHRDGNVVAKIHAVTGQGDITANRHLIAEGGYLAGKDGIAAPGGTAGLFKIYADTADGDLKVVFGDGTVKTIVTDT
jgi:hypothetical protein